MSILHVRNFILYVKVIRKWLLSELLFANFLKKSF